MKKSEQNINHFFKNIMLLSGTPDWRQRELTNEHPENVCCCSPKEAMDNGWICKPILNLIDCGDNEWPSAVRNVLYREIKLWNESSKIFKPTILVNCTGIEDIYRLREVEWFKKNAGKKFHFISIHSNKKIKEDDGSLTDITAEIDGEVCTSGEAYAHIEQIDNNCFCDDLPIIVAQVEMIGEGINVSSFNAVITASNSDKTAMQQIGRAIRNFKVTKDIAEEEVVKHEVVRKGFLNKIFGNKEIIIEKKIVTKPHTFTKVNDGKANVYVIKDNLESLYELIANLESSHDLTDKCFSWGDRLDCSSGSTPEIIEEEEFCELAKGNWKKIDDSNPEIIEIYNHARDIIIDHKLKSWQDDDVDGNGRSDGEDFKELVNKWVEDKTVEKLTGRKNGIEYLDLYDFMLNRIRELLKDETNKKIWNANRKIFLDMTFGNEDATEFFMTHMSKSLIYNLSK